MKVSSLGPRASHRPLTLTPLLINPSYFRNLAVDTLARKRDELIEVGELEGWTARVEAIPAYGAGTITTSVRDELARTDRAIRLVERGCEG